MSVLDDKLLSILVCPADRGPLLLIDDELLYNPRLRRAYRIDDGIPVLLVDEARAVDDEEHRALMARAGSTSGGPERSDPGTTSGGPERSDPGSRSGGPERSDPGTTPADPR